MRFTGGGTFCCLIGPASPEVVIVYFLTFKFFEIIKSVNNDMKNNSSFPLTFKKLLNYNYNLPLIIQLMPVFRIQTRTTQIVNSIL